MILRTYWKPLLVTVISTLAIYGLWLSNAQSQGWWNAIWWSAITVALLASAVIGSWFKQRWVQHCFYLLSATYLLWGLFGILITVVHSHKANIPFSIAIIYSTLTFSLSYLIVWLLFCVGILTKCFFDPSPAKQKNQIFLGLIMATGVGNCIFFGYIYTLQLMPGYSWISDFHPTAWMLWVLLMLQFLFETLLLVGLPLLFIAFAFKQWRFWHAWVAGITMAVLFFAVATRFYSLDFRAFEFKFRSLLYLAQAICFPIMSIAATSIASRLRQHACLKPRESI